jgi:chemotaxis protein methyltransferase CheR
MGFFGWFAKQEEEERVEVQEIRSADFSSFKQVTDFIYEKSGITDLDKRALTSSRLQKYAISQDVYTTSEFLQAMQNSLEFYQEVINIATVNETFFLREEKELYWLIEYIASSHKKLKILSMPCSSGEEVYSILLLMLAKGRDISNVEIEGYDINSDAIKRAQKGEYDEHSLHKIEAKTKAKYFHKNEEGYYEINDTLKKNVTFSQQNIFNIDRSRERYDIVLSRNMFIYFDDEKRKVATDIIVDLLKPEGVFIKGHADDIYEHPKLKNLAYGIYSKQI